MLRGSTDVAALLRLVTAWPDAIIRILPSLHAKVYIADSVLAIVTSANLTHSGLTKNLEYGVKLSNRSAVARIKQDILDYGSLGSPVSLSQLSTFARTVEDLKETASKAERSLSGALRRQFEERLASAELEVLKVRAAGRSPHAIFSDAVAYLLGRGPMTTEEIHSGIKQIHPDLCDDTVERIIDGKRFGKKWKHAVRTAQQHLKQQERVFLRDGKWQLAK
jgi:hypothetical protein